MAEDEEMADKVECHEAVKTVEEPHVGRVGRGIVHGEEHLLAELVEGKTSITERTRGVNDVVVPLADHLHGGPYGFQVLG